MQLIDLHARQSNCLIRIQIFPWINFTFQRKRLEGRGTETEESLKKRLDSTKEALDFGEWFLGLINFVFQPTLQSRQLNFFLINEIRNLVD